MSAADLVAVWNGTGVAAAVSAASLLLLVVLCFLGWRNRVEWRRALAELELRHRQDLFQRDCQVRDDLLKLMRQYREDILRVEREHREALLRLREQMHEKDLEWLKTQQQELEFQTQALKTMEAQATAFHAPRDGEEVSEAGGQFDLVTDD
jgi:hypothetical protein